MFSRTEERNARLDPENAMARIKARYAQSRVTNRPVECEATQALTPAMILNYIYSGKAVFTLKSLKSNKHMTFQVAQKVDKKPGTRKIIKRYDLFFVSCMTRGDNHTFTYMGTTTRDTKLVKLTRKSKFTIDDPAFRAINWALNNPTHPDLRVFHDNSCGRCGLRLTVPESVKTGIGPICAGRIQEEKRAKLRMAG